MCSENSSWSIFLAAAIADSKDQAFSIQYNLLHPFDENNENEDSGENYITGDPKFKDKTKFDFTLLSGSPAIDAGAGTAILFDFNGQLRPSGKSIDVGAFEFQH